MDTTAIKELKSKHYNVLRQLEYIDGRIFMSFEGYLSLMKVEKLGGIYLVKVFPINFLYNIILENINEEIKLYKEIESPYVVKFHDSFVTDKFHYVLLNFDDGKNLAFEIFNDLYLEHK
ncbi:hypothetical protein MHBO_002566 [Bonamia ostreae]|uniref:Uncharacterized protein n=1 Tax=Bonamia ostreae TaxID=126728 RepID=A0ABV2AMR9_9EUKA